MGIFPPHPSRLGIQVKNSCSHLPLGLNSDFQDDDWCCKNSPKMLFNAFRLPSWKWLLLGKPAGFIRNPNHLAAFCPEPSLQLLVICYVSRFCPFLIVKVAATSSFHLGRHCCIDACRGSFLRGLQKQKNPNSSEAGTAEEWCYHHRTLSVTNMLPNFALHLWSCNNKKGTYSIGRVHFFNSAILR